MARNCSEAGSEHKRGVFSFFAQRLADGRRLDEPSGFAKALDSDLAELAEAYIKPGDTHQLLVDILPEGVGVLLWAADDLGPRLMHANRAFV